MAADKEGLGAGHHPPEQRTGQPWLHQLEENREIWLPLGWSPLQSVFWGTLAPETVQLLTLAPQLGPSLRGKHLLPLSCHSPKPSAPMWGQAGCPQSVPRAWGFEDS